MSTPEGISREEFNDLATSVRDLAEAQRSLAEARTEPERREARGDVTEARADLDALAKQYGVSRESLEKAASEARRAERKEELRPILMEILAEIPDDEETPDDSGGKPRAGSSGDPVAKPEQDDPPKESKKEKPVADSDPVAEHWSERKVGDLVRR